MKENLFRKTKPIKKFSAVGAAVVLAAAASVGNVAAKEASCQNEAINPITGFPEVVLTQGIPEAILPQAIQLVVVREARSTDPKEKLIPQYPRVQTDKNFSDPSYVSSSREFRG